MIDKKEIFSPAEIARAAQHNGYVLALRKEAEFQRKRAQAAEAEVKRLTDELARLRGKGGAI